jgi:hypothetical protein
MSELPGLPKIHDFRLSTPRLLLPSIQVNIRAGRFPRADANGVTYLRVPVRFTHPEAGSA